MRTLLSGAMVYTDSGFKKAALASQGNSVSIFQDATAAAGADQVFDMENSVVLPGLADVHVHLREPGFSYKETIASGTRAAARGGFTDVCSMPNLDPPPDCPEHLRLQLDCIAKDAAVHVHPYGAITRGRQGRELADMAGLASDVVAFTDDGSGVQDGAVMERAMRECARLDGLIAAHCEDERLLCGGYIHDGRYARRHGHAGISSQSEWAQLARDLDLCRRTGCRYHVCHVSTKQSVELLRKAKQDGLPVTCETAPHYLVLCDEDLQEDGRFKMNPPLRSAEDRQALLDGILDGTIDMIATDHAPHSAQEKNRGLRGSAMGVSGLETAFPVLYTSLVKTGYITLERLVELMSLAPRRIFRLEAPYTSGGGANLTVVDVSAAYEIDPQTFLSMGRSTPFAGMRVFGKAVMTIVDGRIVWQE